uniref:Uncharacterized protein n=1 Tax=Romanomermis culicivorax TaxID=13658 RepID=A0A915I265_ROMCU
MLATRHYPPRINLSVEFFLLRTMQEIAFINFFGRLGIHITIAIHIGTTNASLAIYQYYHNHFHPSYLKIHPPISPDIAILILQWFASIWAKEI